MILLDRIHEKRVHARRVQVLSRILSELITPEASLLDVGCGDGLLADCISKFRPDIRVEGIDILVRPATHVPVRRFDGLKIPFEDKSFDTLIFVDVLHHARDPVALLREAKRVARKNIVIKDHTRNGFLAEQRLRFMDWMGNARHGVSLPYNYWSLDEWQKTLTSLELPVDYWQSRLDLYPMVANWIFGSSLQFVARLGLGN